MQLWTTQQPSPEGASTSGGDCALQGASGGSLCRQLLGSYCASSEEAVAGASLVTVTAGFRKEAPGSFISPLWSPGSYQSTHLRSAHLLPPSGFNTPPPSLSNVSTDSKNEEKIGIHT